MTYHGDCVGPVGAKLYHGSCPGTWTSQSTGREYACECACHGDDLSRSECKSSAPLVSLETNTGEAM